MKKTILRTVLSGLIALACITSPLTAAKASAKGSSPLPSVSWLDVSGNSLRSVYISSFSSNLEIIGGTATINSRVIANSSTTYSVNLKVYLQKQVGSSWSTIQSWSASGTSSASIVQSKTLSSTGYYRIKCVAVANGKETLERYAYSSY